MRIMKKTTLIFASTFTVLSAVLISCSKDTGCYDEALYQKYKNDFCTMDCLGVVGCDDKTYCNECIARTKGIRVK